ncbi:MAG: PAS domain S-box protein [Anaerolineae bacterium]|nr:PAS domain S-box protein [Anaerolineae bacterium]
MTKEQPENISEILGNDKTIGRALFWISLAVLLALGILIVIFIVEGMLSDAIVILISSIPIAIAMIFNQRGGHRAGAGLIAVVLILMVTVLASIGRGIHDIAIIAYPAILIISSLILEWRMTTLLTTLTILCAGWLVFGEIYDLYTPSRNPDTSLYDFFTVSIVLAVTAIAIQLLARMIQRSLVLSNHELRERKKTERALHEAEEMYRALVEKTTTVTYRDVADPRGSSLYISPTVENLIGYNPSEWTSSPEFWQELVHPEDLPRVLKELETYITTGERSISEYRLRTKNGDWVWVRDEAVVVKDDEGTPKFVHGVYINITEQKTAEKKLKQREKILGAVALTAQLLLKSRNWRMEIGTILDQLGEATGASHVYVFENHPGSDGTPLSSQPYEWTAPGMPPEIDNPIYQNTSLIPNTPGLEDWILNLSARKPFYGSAKQYPEYWRQVFEARGIKTLLDVPILVNGEWWGIIGFDDYVNEMPWSQVEIDALVAAAGNLGTAIERQQMDNALRASEEKFQRAFHHTYVSMAISRTADHILMDVNESFCKVTGYSRDEAIGKRAGRDLKIWARQQDRDFIIHTLEQRGFIDEYQAEFRRKNGEIGMGLLSAASVSIAGEACHLYTFYDISRIDQLLKELRAKNEELQSFTYTVSHDLKAPLVTISGFLGYLEQDVRQGDVEKAAKDIQRINEAVIKMERLLSELLELSRIGRIMNPPEEVPFEEIVREALGLVEGRLHEQQVQVTVEAGLPSVYGDRARLVEVVQNLVDNAAKFMGDQPDPMIEIGTRTENGIPVFMVRDNGIGIEPEHQDRVFGLFNKMNTHSEGTGIGLALVKRIIEVHGGRIWIESEGEGKGSTFLFSLADRPAE